VETIVRDHWRRFGRNFYTRHDYEGIDTERAATLMDTLRARGAGLVGQRFGQSEIELFDDFSYTDPVDGSVSSGQGIRVGLAGTVGGARLVYRLSGTGTEGATLRVYIERHEPDSDRHHQDPQSALADLIDLSRQLADIERHTGRTAPTVIT
jgi:phosphoglucomutase